MPGGITETSLSPEAQPFLSAVLPGDQYGAAGIIETGLASGIPVSGICLRIFQPVLVESGRLCR
jgi:hypothetical protein